MPKIFLIIISLILTGCGAGTQFQTTTTVADFQAKAKEASQETMDLNKQIMASADLSPDVGEYILGPGDLLSVKVFESPDLDSEVRVSARGFVTLPILGTVNIKGLSVSEAEAKIEELLRKDYIRDPHVTVFIKEHVSQQITLVGAVKNPGTYDYISKKSVLDVLAIAGGLTEQSGTVAMVTRKKDKTEERMNFVIDLDQLIKKGKLELNITILGGDVIFIPEAGVVFMDGAVNKPGSYPIKGNMNINEAIVLAGGLSKLASNDEIKLIRYIGGGKRDVVNFNFNDLQTGKGDQVFLKDKDIIYVESSGFKTFFYGLGLNLGLPGLGVGYNPP
jgi:polysaccharide export outer membrane protein